MIFCDNWITLFVVLICSFRRCT